MRKQVIALCLLVAGSMQAETFVKVRYTIRNEAGKVIDATAKGQASVMALSRMMAGWGEAVAAMSPGQTTTITIPEKGYTIDTELIEKIDGPETPADLTAPPAEAVRTRSGLAYVVLREGSGEKKPGRRSVVRVNYSGWTTDGRLFDSTILRGQPAEFPLDKVIAGWTEGLMMMREGEKRRFWIPAKLAYDRQLDKPQGMLIFEIELLQIK
jgi:peptidylprolyl isomerase